MEDSAGQQPPPHSNIWIRLYIKPFVVVVIVEAVELFCLVAADMNRVYNSWTPRNSLVFITPTIK